MQKNAPALELQFVASRWARLFFCVGGVLAGMGCVALPLEVGLPALAVLGFYVWWCWRGRCLGGWVRLVGGRFVLARVGEVERACCLLRTTVVTEHLVVLQGRDEVTGRFVAVALWGDSMGADAHRLMRAHLRWRVVVG